MNDDHREEICVHFSLELLCYNIHITYTKRILHRSLLHR